MAAPPAIVDVELEERYWYPDDGGIVWLAGYQPVAPDGRFLARDAPELAAAGLRVSGVAGAAQHHADVLATEEVAPGRPLELRRDPANEHDPNAIAVHAAGGGQVGWVPRGARSGAGAADRRRHGRSPPSSSGSSAPRRATRAPASRC